MRTDVIVFPFDLFGSSGTAAGAQLLGDSLREMIDDTQAESQPVRQKAIVQNLNVLEVDFQTLDALAKWRATGRQTLRKSLKQSDFTLWLSGNHLGCLPAYEELQETLIIQFDAHLDCYDLHDTHDTLSHGNFLNECQHAYIINIGHRDLFLTSESIRSVFQDAHSAVDCLTNESTIAGALKKRIAKAKQVWIDIDVDVFDPSVCPAVHLPSPFGFTGLQVLHWIERIGFTKLRGVSLSEYDPGRDEKDQSLNLLGWLVEWLLLRKHSC